MFECVPRVNGISTKKETCGQWIKIQQYAFGLLSIIYLNLFSNNEKKSKQKKKSDVYPLNVQLLMYLLLQKALRQLPRYNF